MAEPTSLLKKVKADYQQYFDYGKPYMRGWDKFWKLWNNQRINKQYHGTNNSFEPMTFQMVETIVDNVYGSRPKLTFLPTRVEQDPDTKTLNGLWDFSWDKADMDSKIMPFGRESTITGNGAFFCGWEDGCMTMTHFPLRDCIFDTSAKTPDEMRFAGYRRLAMLDDLKKEERYDPDKGWIKRYSNLDSIDDWSAKGDDATDKELKDAYKGTTLAGDAKKGQVEVIYMAYKDQIVEVANRRKIIAKYDNPFRLDARTVQVQLHNDEGDKMFDENSVPQEVYAAAETGVQLSPEELAESLQPEMTEIEIPAIEPFLPVAMHRGFVDPALLLAKGDVESFAGLQEDLNDEINIKKDNLIYRQQNVALVDKRQSGELIPLLADAKPGDLIEAEGIAQGQDPVRWIDKPEVTADADIEINRLVQSTRNTARVDQVTQGVSTQNDRTATEIQAQVAGASSGFATKSRNLESGLYKDLGEMFCKMVQIFITEKQLVRIVGREGVEFKQFDPNKYWGEYDVKVVLEQQAKAKARDEAERIMGVYKLFLNDPSFNQVELKKLVAQKAFDMDEDDLKLIMNPAPDNAAMAGGMPVGDVASGSPVMQGPQQALPPGGQVAGPPVG